MFDATKAEQYRAGTERTERASCAPVAVEMTLANSRKGASSGSVDKRRNASRLLAIKSTGYLISTVSVVLLGVVSWKKASEDPLLAACLIGGMATSILGMLLRWLSYEIEERRKAKGQD